MTSAFAFGCPTCTDAPLVPVDGACFDGPGRKYRYSLWRRLGPGDRRIVFVMLNPSTADGQTNDNTIERCIAFARAWRFDVLEVVNVFGMTSTDPAALVSAPSPVQPMGSNANDTHLRAAVDRAELVVAAWGANVERRALKGWARRTIAAIPRAKLHALALTAKGSPRHPLYLRGSLRPRPYDGYRFTDDEATS